MRNPLLGVPKREWSSPRNLLFFFIFGSAMILVGYLWQNKNVSEEKAVGDAKVKIISYNILASIYQSFALPKNMDVKGSDIWTTRTVGDKPQIIPKEEPSKNRHNEIVNYLVNQKPDLILLQEMDEPAVIEQINAKGYEAYACITCTQPISCTGRDFVTNKKDMCLSALNVKKPTTAVLWKKTSFEGAGDAKVAGKCICKQDTTYGGKTAALFDLKNKATGAVVTVGSFHLPGVHGGDSSARSEMIKEIFDHTKDKVNVLIGGDTNIDMGLDNTDDGKEKEVNNALQEAGYKVIQNAENTPCAKYSMQYTDYYKSKEQDKPHLLDYIWEKGSAFGSAECHVDLAKTGSADDCAKTAKDTMTCRRFTSKKEETEGNMRGEIKAEPSDHQPLVANVDFKTEPKADRRKLVMLKTAPPEITRFIKKLKR